jgi:serine phosphatase RsbU (regulator of sigma subunit)
MIEERTLDIQAKNEALKAEKQRMEDAHQKMQESIEFASTIQQAILHPEEQVTEGLPEHFILFKPFSQVSGDFHWGKVHRGYLYAAAVDCTGHGVPGAMMSMLGISYLNDIMTTAELLDPADILDRLRDRVINELKGVGHKSGSKSGMDAAMVRIPLNEEKEKEVLFAGANLPSYVVQKGIGDRTPSEIAPGQEDRIKPFPKSSDGMAIKADPMPVGYYEYARDSFQSVRLELERGQVIYMFSDGFADQFGGPKGKKFRYGPFKRLLAELHEKPIDEQKKELDRTIENWKAESGQEQIDDILVIGIRL